MAQPLLHSTTHSRKRGSGWTAAALRPLRSSQAAVLIAGGGLLLVLVLLLLRSFATAGGTPRPSAGLAEYAASLNEGSVDDNGGSGGGSNDHPSRHAAAAAAAATTMRRRSRYPSVVGEYYVLPARLLEEDADADAAVAAQYAPSALDRARFAAARNATPSCWDLALKVREPYTAAYRRPRSAVRLQLPGGAPRTAWQWEGRISRALFDSVPFALRGHEMAAAAGGRCEHCTYVLRYKLLGGRLYADTSRRGRDLSGQEDEAEMVEEMLLAALHLFRGDSGADGRGGGGGGGANINANLTKLSDADILVHLGDAAPPGLPLLQANIDRGQRRAGFAIPKRHWARALGPAQFAALRACLDARYPRPRCAGDGCGGAEQQRRNRSGGTRIPRVVWRGASTGPESEDEPAAFATSVRARVAALGAWHSNVLDARLTAHVATRGFAGDCLERLLPVGGPLPLEDFNRYAAVLDADGNAWSDRFRLLVHGNTPVLKQASNYTAYFEHLLAPADGSDSGSGSSGGGVIEQFAPDAADLVPRAAALLAEAEARPARLWRNVDRAQAIAGLTLSHLGAIEAIAAAVAKAAALSDWQPRPEPGYEPVPFSRCCPRAAGLPPEFVAAVRATETR